jgi:hypothetical protein
VPSTSALETLRAATRAVAGEDGRDSMPQAILDPLAKLIDAGSAAIFVNREGSDHHELAGSIGLDGPAAAGLTAAAANPAHAVARTVANATPGYDVLPAAPGGPKLRAHLPLVVARGGSARILGVVAYAYDQPTRTDARVALEAGADLMAVAIDRGRPPG